MNVKIICVVLAVIFLSVVVSMLSGCKQQSAGTLSGETQRVLNPFTSFRDIPGVTDDEINEIEALRKEYDSFNYGMNPTTEAFICCFSEYSELKGFSALFCGWLTELFDIPFKPELYNWGDLIDGLESGEVDFTGDLMATEERRKTYYMTDAIVERTLKSFQIKDTTPISIIAESRLPRFVFLENFAVFDRVSELVKYNFEPIFVNDFDNVYNMLNNYEADALLAMNISEASFDAYNDMKSEIFFPLVYNSASMSTQNAKLEPVISVVQKALQCGGTRDYLTDLYKTGYDEYNRHKLFMQFTEEELSYIKNNHIVKLGAEYDNYPMGFYNTYENQWQGIAFDVLNEVEKLTGLSFDIANDTNTNWNVLLKMLENGEISLLTELVRTNDREGKFLWSDTTIMEDRSVLLSKSEFRDININEILDVKVGVAKGTVHAELLKRWFPDHGNILEYNGVNDVVNALASGEIDIMMSRTNQFLSIMNYSELAGYKINVIFEYYINSTLGFNKNEEVLCSIINKTLKLIDTEAISGNWARKTFDYRRKLAEAQRPWLVGAVIMLLIVLTLLFVFIRRKRHDGIRLEKLVADRTNELELQTLQLKEMEEKARNASETKSRFIANMSHEMRTPLNVVVGLTELMLEETDPDNLNESLKKINIAGSTLMGLINDVLDISKIESGKFELIPIQYDVASILNDIITLNMIRIESKAITFKPDIDNKMPCCLYGDDLRIKQIFNNLLSNAFKYTQEGSVTMRVGCDHEGDEDIWISAQISDTGIGIRQRDLEKLFTDYNQVDTRANRKIEGTGLGLSITKMLVNLMDGEINVESEYGKGTTFSFRIKQRFVTDKPIGPETAGNLCSCQYSETKKNIQKNLIRPDLSYIRVLVVDDFPTNLDVAAGMLRKYKMQVDCVESGQAAIDLIEGKEPLYDAIFMDHMMPGLDGIETTKNIRALGTEYARTIHIIALTANAVIGNEQMFLDNDFQAFLPKPINIMKLDSIVQKWVRDKSRE